MEYKYLCICKTLECNALYFSAVSVIREVQLELILLQFVIPTLLEHGNTRAGFKIFVQFWAHFTANVLYVAVCIVNSLPFDVCAFSPL